MFDIGFSELLLFGVIALIVLGPEKLPQAARTAGQWYAKIRRTVSTLQSEIEAEFDLAETRQQMQKELAKIRETEAEMKREMAEMRGSMQAFEYSKNPKNNPDIHADHQPDTRTIKSSLNATSNAILDEASGERATQEVDDTANLSASTTDSTQPIMTRPWENMWFLLGAYDKAKRLPPAPYLPNYKADVLLYTQSHSNTSIIRSEVKK